MALETGILLAVAALLLWGFGDFLIQRSSRRFGVWETLFHISLTGAVILFPFVYRDLGMLSTDGLFYVLAGASAAILIATLFHFEALKEGKIAVVEPFMALEVPVAAVLAFAAVAEGINPVYTLLIMVLLAGLVLVSAKSHHFSRRAWVERGTLLAAMGAIFMGATNFLVGIASRGTNPLSVVWLIDIFTLLVSIFYLTSNKRLGSIIHDFRNSKRLVLTLGTIDNMGWVAFALAATSIPIGIAVALSENYIALAALLGILVNREVLLKQQKAGLVLALGSAVALVVLYA